MAGTVSVLPDPGTVSPSERYGIDPPAFLLNLNLLGDPGAGGSPAACLPASESGNALGAIAAAIAI